MVKRSTWDISFKYLQSYILWHSHDIEKTRQKNIQPTSSPNLSFQVWNRLRTRNNNYIQLLLVYPVCVIVINGEPKAYRSISRSYCLCLSLIVGRVCCPVYKFVITDCHKIKTHRNSYQCSSFHLHEIHPCMCSYRIPGCCYTQH